MKKFLLCYFIEIIWTSVFVILSVYENNSSQTGLAVLTSIGSFVIYGILSLLGILSIIITLIVQLIKIKKR